MFRLTFVLVLAALVLPLAAAAKGPTAGSITGPGFTKTVKVMFDGGGGSPGDNLTEAAGFFPAAFGQSPDPMLHRKPTGKLGPRYRISWKVPGGNASTFRIRQDVYPYAQGGAVTYTKPGQPIFDMTTRGGWYRNPELKRTLVALGLPKAAPRTVSGRRGGGGSNLGLVAGIGIPGALALAGAAFVVNRRRRNAGGHV